MRRIRNVILSLLSLFIIIWGLYSFGVFKTEKFNGLKPVIQVNYWTRDETTGFKKVTESVYIDQDNFTVKLLEDKALYLNVGYNWRYLIKHFSKRYDVPTIYYKNVYYHLYLDDELIDTNKVDEEFIETSARIEKFFFKTKGISSYHSGFTLNPTVVGNYRLEITLEIFIDDNDYSHTVSRSFIVY